MARRLPDDPAKRRAQIFKRLYQNLPHFQALLESGQMEFPGIITIPDTGEEVYLADLMVGHPTLPPRQRQAFDLICLQGYTETAATKIMLPDSKWSTPCQQYADTALARMVAAYDAKQNGSWNQAPAVITKTPSKETADLRMAAVVVSFPVKRSAPVAADTKSTVVSEVLKKHLEAARAELVAQQEVIAAEIAHVEALMKGAA